jgi:hypothetical protein
MVRRLGNLLLIVALGVLGAGVAKAASDETCRIEKLQAFEKDSACISKATIQGVRKGLLSEEVQDQVDECRTELIAAFERAETRAQEKGRECPTTGDAEAVHDSIATACCPLCGCE